MKPDTFIVKRLLNEETDERYKYLLKHGLIHYIESQTQSLYVELPQIPNIIIVYRWPAEWLRNPDVFNLNSRYLTHIPLLEGEESIKELILWNNKITKIENLVSLPQLQTLDLSNNKLTDISNFVNIKTIDNLWNLDLSNNQIERILSLEGLKNLEFVNLAENKIQKIENLQSLQKLKILNLKNNLISVLENLNDMSLTDIDLTNNRIHRIDS